MLRCEKLPKNSLVELELYCNINQNNLRTKMNEDKKFVI